MKTKRTMFLLFVILCILMSASSVFAQTETPPVEVPAMTETPPIHALANQFNAYMNSLAGQNKFSGSVLLVRHGEVILSKGYGYADQENHIKNTPETRFRIGSITKTFTASAIMQLQDAGALDIDDFICDYLENCPETWSAITIKHLLNHTSGIVSYTSLPEYWEHIAEPQTPEQLIARFIDKPLLFTPGSKWKYSNSNYAILGYLIETLTGEPYDQYVIENIFEPLEMWDSGYDHNDPSLAIGYNETLSAPASYIHMSTPYAAGGLYSTVEDLYKWDQSLYTDQVLSYEAIQDMTYPHTLVWDGNKEYYGLGWSVWDKGQDRWQIGHEGAINGFTSLILRYPGTDSVIIILANHEGADFGTLIGKIYEIFGRFYE